MSQILRYCHCGAEVIGRSIRCEHHKRRRRVMHSKRALRKRSREELRARYRAWWASRSQDLRARRTERNRGWAARNPAKVMAKKRRERLKGAGGYRTREKYLAYQATYNAKRAEQKRITERARYYRKKAAA